MTEDTEPDKTVTVSFEYTFEYTTSQFPDYDDDDFEQMAFSALSDNLHDLSRGTVTRNPVEK